MARLFQRFRHTGWLVGGILLAGALVLWAARWWQEPLVQVEAVVRRDFVQTVVASGHVENPHRVNIGSQITATVVRVPVREGHTVKAGDILIELSAAEFEAAVLQADLAVHQAKARLRQLEEVQAPVAEQTLRQAQANLDTARAVLQRNEDLYSQQFIGAAALDESRKTVELLDAQWRSLQKQLESTRVTGSDYALAEAAVLQAKASADAARARARYTTIRAPLAGLLIGRNVEVGDVAQPGKVLMTLSPQGRPQLIVSIDEKNLRFIELGQQAVVSADAYPQQKFHAELVYISPGINAQTGAVEVKLDVPQPPEILRQDMTVSVDIEVARRPRALLLSAAALHDADGAAPWVLALQGDRAVRTPVQVGLRSGGWMEILQGLREGDRVITGPGGVMAGARVRPRPSGR